VHSHAWILLDASLYGKLGRTENRENKRYETERNTGNERKSKGRKIFTNEDVK
jgi:cytidylate kinase